MVFLISFNFEKSHEKPTRKKQNAKGLNDFNNLSKTGQRINRLFIYSLYYSQVSFIYSVIFNDFGGSEIDLTIVNMGQPKQ